MLRRESQRKIEHIFFGFKDNSKMFVSITIWALILNEIHSQVLYFIEMNEKKSTFCSKSHKFSYFKSTRVIRSEKTCQVLSFVANWVCECVWRKRDKRKKNLKCVRRLLFWLLKFFGQSCTSMSDRGRENLLTKNRLIFR